MKKEKSSKIYCSLDIETSDFDPANGEILELGMIFFEIGDDGIKPLKEWTSTFKAIKEVPPRILALTGITVEELESSGPFQEKHSEIQELVKDAIIVGHNIDFDLRFLQSFGIKFSGASIDTLSLAQLFLPTAVSYNLEAVMNLLKVEHKEAHRALADARASMVVFEKLLRHYAAFPEELRTRLQDLFSAKTEIGVLLQTKFAPEALPAKKEEFPILHSAEIEQSIKAENTIVCFPLGFDYYHYIYGALQKTKEKLVLVVPSKKIVYQLWKNGLAEPLFENSDLFNEKKFEKILKKKLHPDQRLFFGKILVWKYTNWQSKSLIDLNWSFGSQFRALVNFDDDDDLVSIADPKQKVFAVDYFYFIHSDLSALLQKRKILILDINNFESALTYVSSKKVSWGDFLYHLRQIYDPQTDFGQKANAEAIKTLLAQTYFSAWQV